MSNQNYNYSLEQKQFGFGTGNLGESKLKRMEMNGDNGDTDFLLQIISSTYFFFKPANEKGLREAGPHIPDVNRSPLCFLCGVRLCETWLLRPGFTWQKAIFKLLHKKI